MLWIARWLFFVESCARMDDVDDFVSCNHQRTQRRLKALQQQQSTTAKTETKRKTPASAPLRCSKRASLTPKPFSAVDPSSRTSGEPEQQQHSSTVTCISSYDGDIPRSIACSSGKQQQTSRSSGNGVEDEGWLASCSLEAVVQHTQAAGAAEQASADPSHCNFEHARNQPHCNIAHEVPVADSGYICKQQMQAGGRQQHAASPGICFSLPEVHDRSMAEEDLAATKSVDMLCPVCSCKLAAISSTLDGQTAHVNACMDAAAATAAADVHTDTPATTTEELQIYHQRVAKDQGIDVINIADSDSTDWLVSIGAAEAVELFAAADVDLSVLPHLNDYDLEDMGLADAPLRSRILTAAAERAAAENNPGSSSAQQEQLEQQQWQRQPWQQQQQASAPTGMQGCDMQTGWLDDDHIEDMQTWDTADDFGTGAAPVALQGTSTVVQLGTVAPGSSSPITAANQQQEQQQQVGPTRLPLQPACHAAFDARHNRADASMVSSRVSRAATANDPQQSSITGWLRQPKLQHHKQEHCAQHTHTTAAAGNENKEQSGAEQNAAAKQQWQVLFNRPGKVLATPQPVQPKQRNQNQMQLGSNGQLRQCQQQQPQQQLITQQVQLPPQISHCQTPPLPRWWPSWRKLPGTNIVVDAFGQSSKAVGSNRHWVLTHFHADHYMGLSKAFKQGRIFCTPITAALVKLKLRVPDSMLVPVPLGQEVTVEGTRVQFIDANHCPGAAMVVAQPPGNAPPVLHTGDARLTREHTQQQPALQALVGKAVLVLDTTYADPAYCFPPQQEVLQWVLKAVQAESFNPRCLFLFGSYTIGKEKLFLHVAQALKAKVYVAAAKRGVMGCINLSPEQAQLLTTNHLEANIHVVPMRQVTLEAMESLLVRYKGRYTAVVGFQPTGWTHTAAGSSGGGRAVGQATRASSTVRPGKRVQRGTVVLYKVPYSEHSSCAELREFVSWFKPIHIIPSVNNDNGTKLRQMLEAVKSSGRPSGPMDAFAVQRSAV